MYLFFVFFSLFLTRLQRGTICMVQMRAEEEQLCVAMTASYPQSYHADDKRSVLKEADIQKKKKWS